MSVTGRDDYDQMVRFRGVAAGEPTFFIRAQDSCAGPAVRAYAAIARDLGAPAALIEQALRQADKLDAWTPKKLPDADHLTPAEQSQMGYALERRAWDARADAGDLRIMLAEERGYTAARSALRPILAELFEVGVWTEQEDEGVPGGVAREFVYSASDQGGDGAIGALQNLATVMRPPFGDGAPWQKLANLASALLAEAVEHAEDSARRERDSRARELGIAEGLRLAAEMVRVLAKDV